MSKVLLYSILSIADIAVLVLDAIVLYRTMRDSGIKRAGLPVASISLIAFALGTAVSGLIYYATGTL